MRDLYDRYLRGVGDLLQAIEPTDTDYLTVLTLQGRLAQAIAEMRQYGSTDDARAEIARVTTELDRLCLEHLGKSFRSLCGIDELPEASSPKIYQNLPQPDYGRFIGREKELAKIYGLLSPANRHFLVTIDGIGGIGKTTLALEVAHHYLQDVDELPESERFDAIIWTSAKRDVLTGEGIVQRQQVLRTLNDIYTTISITLEREDITRARSEEQPELVRRALARQRTLLIVDNLETVDDEDVLTFLRELPAPTKAIVTTRHRMDVAYPVRLEEMPWEEAQQLIVQECEKKGIVLEDEQVHKLYERTGGVPLALVWSIAQMGAGYGIDAVLTRLGSSEGEIARFCFEGMVERIRGADAHKLLMALALFATDASREALGYVAGLAGDQLSRDEGLVRLEKLSLVNKQSNRFSLSPLTKEYALAEMDALSAFREQAVRRFLDYLKELGASSDTEYYWRWHGSAFIQDGLNVLEAISWALDYGNVEDVFALTSMAYDYLETTGRWEDAVKYAQRALSLAYSVQNRVFVARMSNILGWISRQRGDYQEALPLFREALGYYQEMGNQEGLAMGLQHLSGVYRKMKQFDQARQFCDEAWHIARGLGVGDLRALIDTEYGKLARDVEDWETAWKHFAAVRDWFQHRAEETPRDETLARSAWGHLAIVAYHLGRHQEAKELCLKSLEFFETSGTKAFLATLHYRLALAEEALKEYEEAYKYAKLAVDWFERLGMKPDLGEAEILLARLGVLQSRFWTGRGL